MRRREFIALAAAGTAWLHAAHAQQPANRVWRVGVLENTSAELNAVNFGAFRDGLRELGYREGKNLVIEYRSADGQADRFPALAAELVRLNVDAIVTRGTPAALAARNATATIPVVMAAIAEAAAVGGNIAHPAGNVTGLTAFTSELEPKRVQLLKEIVPGAARIAALYDMANPVFAARWQQLQAIAPKFGMQPQLLDARNRADIERAFDLASQRQADVLSVSNDGLLVDNRKLIVGLAARHRLPAVYPSREYVVAGGLMSYSVKFSELYRRAAAYVDKIFKGVRPSDLPIEQPAKFELIVNLKAAKAIGLAIPESFLSLRADEVIE